jgi:SHS2 domain-containing protein
MGNYRLIEHTADLGIEVWGSSMGELFTHSACAMYDIISNIVSIHPIKSFHIKSKGIDKEDLLKNWLSELLYYFHLKDILFSSFNIEKISDKSIISVASGEKRDEKRHALKHDIKAVTYHGLKIIEKDNRLQTNIIFDV